MYTIEKDWELMNSLLESDPAKTFPALRAKQVAQIRSVMKDPGWKKLFAEITEHLKNKSWISDFHKIINLHSEAENCRTVEQYLVFPFIQFIKERLQNIDKKYTKAIIIKVEKSFYNYLSAAAADFSKSTLFVENAIKQKKSPNSTNIFYSFYTTYPVLGRILTSTSKETVRSVRQFHRRLKKDICSITSLVNEKKHLNDIISVIPLNSDVHSNGEVLQVCFKDGSSVIYKPKQGNIDTIVNEMITTFNELTGKTILRKIDIVVRKNYFWQRTIVGSGRNKTSKAAVWKMAGSFLALCNLLLMEDHHIDNLKVAGSSFIGIDNEFIFTPRFPQQLNSKVISDPILNRNFYYSLLNHKILPDLFRLFYNDFDDQYGLLQIGTIKDGQSIENLKKGFMNVYDSFNHNRAKYRKIIASNNLSSRVLIRPTYHYYRIIEQASDPNIFSSHVNFLHYLVATLTNQGQTGVKPYGDYFVPQEIAFLFDFRIPFFSVRPRTTEYPFAYDSGRERKSIQLANWDDPGFITKQLRLLDLFCEYSNRSFYLDVNAKTIVSKDFETIAFKLAEYISLLYGCLDDNKEIFAREPDYLSFENGILGVCWFLVVAEHKKPDAAGRHVIDKLINVFFCFFKNKAIDLTSENIEGLTAGWVKGILLIDKYYVHPDIEKAKYCVLGMFNKMVEKKTGKSAPERCTYSQYMAVIDRYFIKDESIEMTGTLTEQMNILTGIYCSDSDTLKGGNFGWINALLNLGQGSAGHLKCAKEKCREVILSRRRSGFILQDRVINPYLMEGLSGIGLILFKLSDDHLPTI